MKTSEILKAISHNKSLTKPVIYGIKGYELSDEEKYFFSKNSCLGFILFARNIKDKDQVKKLTQSLRELMNGEILILIDQEGGRVARLKPPHWPNYPTGQYFFELYQKNHENGYNALKENFQKIANDLVEIGINVDCAPVLDISCPQTHQVIGDRAYGDDPYTVSELGKAVCEGLLQNNVFPVIKHIPGHGRGSCDSHLELPKVSCSFDELVNHDFIPFKALKDQKFAMTAHILYQAIDPKNCATLSKTAIDLIRNEIGFKNILMSDDVSMKALNGSFSERSKLILQSGCDLVLHCNGEMTEMLEINSALPFISEKFWQKFTQ